MKIVPTVLAVLFGSVFLSVGLALDHEPSEHTKARAAVLKILVEPRLARFEGLRTIELRDTKYVCGAVNAKNGSGAYAGSRAFVYELLGEFVAVDNDDGIVTSHRAFNSCPVANRA